MTDNTMTKR